MKRLTFALLFLTLGVLSAQKTYDKDYFFKLIRLDAMSEQGKDTIYHYTNGNLERTFLSVDGGIDRKTYEEARAIVDSIFVPKLSAEDLAVLHAYWDELIVNYRSRILAVVPQYAAALACQESLVDSLLGVYLESLKYYSGAVEAALTDEQILRLQEYDRNSLQAMRNKGNEFSEYHTRFTDPIAPVMHRYVRHSFSLMEKIPTVSYYSLLSLSTHGVTFAKDFATHRYVGLYTEFQSALATRLVEDPACQAHLALPFYHEGRLDSDMEYPLNALLFGLRQKWFRTVESPPQKVSWPDEANYLKPGEYSLDQIIDTGQAQSLGWQLVEEDTGGEEGLVFKNVNSQWDYLLLSPFHYSRTVNAGQLEALEAAIGSGTGNQYEIAGKRVCLVVDAPPSGLASVSGLVFYRKRVIAFEFLTERYEENHWQQLLGIIK